MNCLQSYCLIVLIGISQVGSAETIKGLLDAGELEARTVVKTPTPHYQKTPIEIVVEVGTPDRFKNGIRVRDFTVPGVLVRRLTKSAFNETRRREGASWQYQSWRFALHAERAGILKIPGLSIFVSVETETDGVVESEIKLAVPQLEIEVAPGTQSLDSWVAANEFKVEESWEGVLDEYEIGDAVTRIRKLTIIGSPAMSVPASPLVEIDGVDVYHAPPLVDDQEIGGKLEGVREERVVFTFKGGGIFAIPDDRVHWFNLKSGAVEQIDLPGRRLGVSGPAAPVAGTQAGEEEHSSKFWYWLLAVLAMVIGFFLFKQIRRPVWFKTVRARLQGLLHHRHAKTEFMKAAKQQDSSVCLALLYERMSEHNQWQLGPTCAGDPRLGEIADTLMASLYNDGAPPDPADLRLLWNGCTRPKKKRNRPGPIQLNPGPG